MFGRRHPLFPLLALLFEKCEQSTLSSDCITSASFDVDIENFVRCQEKEGNPFFSEDPELDNLVSSRWPWGLMMHRFTEGHRLRPLTAAVTLVSWPLTPQATSDPTGDLQQCHRVWMRVDSVCCGSRV